MKLHWRIWFLIIVLIVCALIIAPPQLLFQKGVIIQAVEKNSTEFNQGLRSGMIITSINSIPITNLESYNLAVSKIFASSNQTVKVTILADKTTFIFFAENQLNIAVKEISKTRLKTGLDLSGGARALVKAENKKGRLKFACSRIV